MFSYKHHYLYVEFYRADIIMSKNKYTTIQIRKEISQHIKDFCREKGLIAATITENYWLGLISSSMSGSLIL
jgi:hypothetical protein